MNPRFEIVRTDAGWHSRLIGGNGEIVWTTEVYTRAEAAQDAIQGLVHFVGNMTGNEIEVFAHEVDERTVQG